MSATPRSREAIASVPRYVCLWANRLSGGSVMRGSGYRLSLDVKTYRLDKLLLSASQVFELLQDVRIDRHIGPISPKVDVPCHR